MSRDALSQKAGSGGLESLCRLKMVVMGGSEGSFQAKKTLSIKIAQKPYMTGSLGPKSLNMSPLRVRVNPKTLEP